MPRVAARRGGRRLRADRARRRLRRRRARAPGRAGDGDGYRLNGEKVWISNAPDADIYTVFARTTEGAGARGLTALRGPARRARASPASRSSCSPPHPIGRLVFDGRPRAAPSSVLGEVDRGFAVAMRTLDLFRPSVGAFAVGMAAGGARRGRRPRRRRATRSAAAQGPAGGLPPARRRRDPRSRRRASLVHDAARAYDRGLRPITQVAAMAKLFATEIAQEAVDVADPGPRRPRARARPPARAPLPRGPRAADLRGRLGDPARDHRPHSLRPRRSFVKVAIIGGGPGGLYASILLGRLGHEVTVWERNAPDDTFGFGVVFSDETLAAFEAADPPSYAEIAAQLRPLGRHRHLLPRHGRTLRRPRLLGARPDAAAEHPPGAGRGGRRRRSTSAPRRRRTTS